MAGEEVELQRERGANAVEGIPTGDGEIAERPLEVRGALAEHGGKQAALRVEIVKQQLLVHAGAARNPGDSRAFEAVPGKLFAGCGDNA